MSPNRDDRSSRRRWVVRRALTVSVLAAIGWFAVGGFAAEPVAAAPSAPATGPAPTNATCAVTGYSAADDVALEKLVAQLGKQTAFQVGGMPLRNPCRQIDGFTDGLLKQVLTRDADGAIVRRAGIMGVVPAGGTVRAGDRIAVELPAGERRPLDVV
jgi:hypothetical protein